MCRQILFPFRLSRRNPYIFPYALILIGFLGMFGFRVFATKSIAKRFEYKTFDSAEAHHLKILWSKEKGEGNKRYIIGEVKNEGSDTFTSLSIEGEVLDKDNNLIRIENAYIQGTTKPGDVRAFQLAKDCGEKKPAIDEHYKLEVIDGILKHSSTFE